jgi:hypothetical protein
MSDYDFMLDCDKKMIGKNSDEETKKTLSKISFREKVYNFFHVFFWF